MHVHDSGDGGQPMSLGTFFVYLALVLAGIVAIGLFIGDVKDRLPAEPVATISGSSQ